MNINENLNNKVKIIKKTFEFDLKISHVLAAIYPGPILPNLSLQAQAFHLVLHMQII